MRMKSGMLLAAIAAGMAVNAATMEPFPDGARVEVVQFVGADKGGAALAEQTDLLAAIPEAEGVKEPLFAFKISFGGASLHSGPIVSAWIFAWRDGTDYRAIVRIPATDLPTAFGSMIQMQGALM